MSRKPPQPRTQTVAPSSSPNILTLRVHHEKASFTVTFKRGSQQAAHTRLNAAASAFIKSGLVLKIPTTLPNSLCFCQKPPKARDLCDSSQRPSDSASFRKRMDELMIALGALCEGEHPSNKTKSRPATGSVLRSFRTNNLDRNTVSEELRPKIMTPLALSEAQGRGLGYIYILRPQSCIKTLSALKIGFSKYHPEHRAHELAGCVLAPEVVAHTPLIPHAKRIESLIHIELVAQRKVHACGQCGQEHREWFTISHAEAREIITRRSIWMLRQPYLDDKLSERWRTHLRELDFGSTNPEATMLDLWGDILDNFPHQDTDSTPGKQVAGYMNASYFENLISGELLEIHNFMRAMDGFISSKSKVRNDPGIKPRSQSESGSSASQYNFEDWKKGVFEKMKAIKNLKTGSISALGQMDATARGWIGYNPTHAGFQFLQEAYQRGEWVGTVPQFKLPKSFRKAGITKLSAEAVVDMKDRDPSYSTQPSSGRNQPNNSADAQVNTEEASGRLSGRRVRFIRSEDADRWEFSTEMNDAVVELMKHPLGEALVRREALRELKNFGLDLTGGYEHDALSSSSESSMDEMSMDEMSVDKMSIGETGHMQGEVNTRVGGSTNKEPANVSTSSLQPGIQPRSGLAISKAKAKLWLGSI
ncbi:hypothetical protein DL769_010429 [Monosporascus sp. CRB-8-3]|nr:hypothetical protein DL769_010429 [Monosporascus sp. CRB-8-3]